MLDTGLSNLYLLLYILAWGYALLLTYKKKKKWGVASVIIASYVVYAVLSFMLFNNKYAAGEYKDLTLFPFVYLFLMLLIFLQPVIRYNEEIAIDRPSIRLINAYVYLYIFVSIGVLPYTLSHIQDGLFLILNSDTAGAELYNLSREGVASHSMFEGLISAAYNILSDIGVFLFFYYLTVEKRNSKVVIALAFCPFISILYSISSGLRTEATMKILIIITTFFMFRYHLSERIKNRTKILIGSLGTIVLFLMITLSITRFNNFSGGASYQALRYIGSANLNFNNYCLDAGGIRYGDRTVNTFKHMLGFENVPRDLNETRAKYQNMKIDDSSFYTFVGDFTLDFGPVIAVFIFVIFTMLMLKVTTVPRARPIKFHQLLMVFFVTTICVQGGMYMFYYSYKQNYVIIAYVISYYIFRSDYKKRTQHLPA